MRAVRRIVAVVTVLLACLVGYGLARITGDGQRWIARFLRLAGRALGARVRVDGRPLAKNVLFVANHVSWLDILAVGGATGAAFVSKDGIARWPVIGWLARTAGTIFIARERRAAAGDQARTLAAALASGRPVALFPEGTTGPGDGVLPFRAALFAALDTSRAQVQPIAIGYGAERERVAWVGQEPAAVNALRVIGGRGPVPITLRFLEPFSAAGMDRKQVAARARAAIAAVL